MLIAYNGKQETKDFYVARMLAHQQADEIIHGEYWNRGKGCAVGCTIHGDDHGRYETELGVPIILARLEDRIFEGMANGYAKQFPLDFLSAISPGADLSLVWPKFAVWLLVDPVHGVVRYTKKGSAQYVAIHRVADLYRELKDWDRRDKDAFRKARTAASASAASAASAAYAAYASAASAASAYAADASAASAASAYAADAYAAYASAASAASAYAADASAASAASAYAADAAYARSKSHKAQADKLIELLRSA